VIISSVILLACVAAYFPLSLLLPPESLALAAIGDVGILLLEAVVLVLCWLAYRCNEGKADRWIWVLLGIWALGNLAGDSAWTYYEVVRQVEVPAYGLDDIGFLAARVLSIGTLLYAAWRNLGRMKTAETAIDAAILTVGVAGLCWPLVLSPMLEEHGKGLDFWVSLAYPVGDLMMILGLAALLFAHWDSIHRRLPVHLVLVCVAFFIQITADTAYFALISTGREYLAGSWLGTLWTPGIVLVGIAALLGMRAGSVASVATTPTPVLVPGYLAKRGLAPGSWRAAIPYLALPTLVAMFAMQMQSGGWRWNSRTEVLFYLGVALVGLLVIRQYVALRQNRRLYDDLTQISRELETKVEDLADLNERLEVLNDSSHRLTSLRQAHAVAQAGLEIACTFARSPGGWITMDLEGETVTVTLGSVNRYHPGELEFDGTAERDVALRALPLEIRDESLGTMWLVEPAGSGSATDLLPVVATQLASALDNARRYEEALRLAERDPLTGLFNHRGIHRRLAGEALRAQQANHELSLIMIDLDDFKVLNDTYGHAAGDFVLRQVSDAIRAVLRHADMAGRVGGDELLLVLPNTGAEGALQLSDRLRVALAARPYMTPGGHSIPVYLSLGVATFPDDAQSLGHLIETADANLYASKQRGGNATTGRRAEAELESEGQGLLGVAGRLLDAVGARDHYTRRHSEHVVQYALSLGEAAGLSEDSLCTLHVAAMLHDVGKIGVPADLLRRPASLSAAEEQMVREHVKIGPDVIMDMPRLAEVAAVVYAHHEHHDGTGYPTMASGDDIPILGRILAVADAYSAMILDRPYRKSMSRAQAREELLKAAGTQLDPELVRSFIQILDARELKHHGEHASAG
jgi:diguanylate cyclase (GGDEF)-like protein